LKVKESNLDSIEEPYLISQKTIMVPNQKDSSKVRI
jgi:hypothetical protein